MNAQQQITALRLKSKQDNNIDNPVQQQQGIGARSFSWIVKTDRYKALYERCTANMDLFAGIFHLSVKLVIVILGLGIFFLSIALKYSKSADELLTSLGLTK